MLKRLAYLALCACAPLYAAPHIDDQRVQQLANDPFWISLGHYEARKLGGWRSYVSDDKFFLAKDGAEHPDAELIAHPECEDHILAKSAFIGSTSMLLKYVQESSRKKFIVGTEYGIVHQMEKHTTGKTFLPLPPEANCSCNECPHMKRNTLEKLFLCMKNMHPQIEMNSDLLNKARKPIDKMLAMS